jgi:LmbE family N-acetylglucosaminyl deacetylase
MSSVSALLSRFCGEATHAAQLRVVVFAAHPDDEIVSLGGRIAARAAELHVVYVSDGAPEDRTFFEPLGFSDRDAYALARRNEARAALALAGVPAKHVHEIGARDQETAFEIPRVARAIVPLLARIQPDAVLTHPYEGGHPDHDATACAVHAALASHDRGARSCPLLEFASYHERDGQFVFGEFLQPEEPAYELRLNDQALSTKRQMLACHVSQRDVLEPLPIDVERFRVAPRYDFRRPPDAPFYYDRHHWRVSGEHFLRLADAALSELGVEEPC